MTRINGVARIEHIIRSEPQRLLVLFDKNKDDVCRVVADVLGQTFSTITSLECASEWTDYAVLGIENSLVQQPEILAQTGRIVINTHCMNGTDYRDERLTEACDYEYLYSSEYPTRRDLARFLGFILGQNKCHDELCKKTRTTMLSTTFPDIRAALPNFDILSVGADSVELRVDLLKEQGVNSGAIPSIKYVGEQVMLLRERTELPLIFTIRCTNENGRFPMDNPDFTYRYLRKAIQWGCEYIDVELWLPEDIRHNIAEMKGRSKIISAWHDFSGNFKWNSNEALEIFRAGAVYGDIVKMITLVDTMEQNYELEFFRSTIQSQYNCPPFSGLNMGPVGQLSRTLNKVFTPITHPLLPMVAAPGQLSAAEINSMLRSMGKVLQSDLYAVGNVHRNGQATFFGRCVNELSLPYQIRSLERSNDSSMEYLMAQENFGGAYINPPLPINSSWHLEASAAAVSIGQIDTVIASMTSAGRTLLGDNATWKGIRATLRTECVPSSYNGRDALLLAHSELHAAATIYALEDLGIGTIYTIGFECTRPTKIKIRQLGGFEDLKRVENPFAIISALPAEKSFVVSPLLKYYSCNNTQNGASTENRVFIDLSNGISGAANSVSTASSLGWMAYGIADVNASTMVETLRLLVGQNLPCDFVRLAAGNSLYH
ncbi:Hypothetical protein R9X50_00165200 [Acrodontium crateriforme]|uniref:3-dehydroquinate dehydratase n=1 Tax=Acrodontium crateriforme TaxID=150365 RepID=A0AAQ3LZP8_9PEZI|nr:Hypothetical protein R9X50_00165200 [Acrodontium crateriforme]